MRLQFKADPNCKFCHGSGTVVDRVPYGSTTAEMTSECECAVGLLSSDQYNLYFADIDSGDYDVIPADEYLQRFENHETPLGEQLDSLGELED